MAEAQTPSKSGLTRGNAILIGILAVALVAILYVQFGGKAEKPAGEAAGYRPPRPAVAVQPVNSTAKPVTLASAKTPSNVQADKDKAAATELLIDETRWKSPKLETIAAYDPLALPPSFPQPPKVVAGAFVDLTPWFERCLSFYSESERNKMFDLKERLVTMALTMFDID